MRNIRHRPPLWQAVKRKDDYWLAIKLSFYSNSDCPSNNLLNKRWKEYKWGKLLSKGQSAH